MKSPQSFIIITAVALFFTFCDKEDLPLGEQIEGSWLVKSYLYNDEEYIDPEDVFTIDFSDYRDGKGETNWLWTSFIVSANDSSGGVYSIQAERNTMFIEWSNPLFWGGYEDVTFNILKFTSDTLVLDAETPGVSHYHITAVRN